MYYTYILQCADNTLYTGITNNLKKRLYDHNFTDKGAKYTRQRRPVKLVYFEEFKNKSLASKNEWRIKKLNRNQKLELVKGFKKENY